MKSAGMDLDTAMRILRELSRPQDLDGMARFGIPKERNLGVRVPELRRLARQIGTDQTMAERLWDLGYRETRLLASMIYPPHAMSEAQMESWLKELDSWEITDGCALNCFWSHPLARRKAVEWSKREREFEKRAGFTLMAILAVKDKAMCNEDFIPYLEAVRAEAEDGRNFVKKAINWALRQIGKRNEILNCKSIETSELLQRSESRAARWVAADALRELRSSAVQERLKAKAGRRPLESSPG